MNESVMDAGQKTKERGLRSRKVRAILAGGLVLGLGAAVTLAAWNDSEFAKGTFTSGSLNIQGSVDGDIFEDHTTPEGASVLFSLETGDLAPGDVYSAPFAVRLDEGSTKPANVTLTSGDGSATPDGLKYRVFETEGFGCSTPTAPPELVVGAGTPVGTVPANTSFSLAPGAGVLPGTAKTLCFEVTADDDLAQETTSEVVWHFEAELAE